MKPSTYIITAGLLSLFLSGCLIYAYQTVINEAQGLHHDPTVFQPYQHNPTVTDDPLTTKFPRLDP